MKAQDSDTVKRWQSISEWYAEFANLPGWEFLQPMIGITAWVGEQPFGARLYPGTSHEWLCVDLHPGYNPEQPFFSCVTKADWQFECTLWERVGRRLSRQIVPIDQAQLLFTDYVGKLLGKST